MIYTQPLVLKFVGGDAETGTFSGLGSTWSIDRTGEKIQRGAFARTIEALNAGSQHIPLLFEHKAQPVIGSITSASETDQGLEVGGLVVLGEPTADRAQKLLKARGVGLSVGFTPRAGGVTRDAAGCKIYTNVDWLELSVTGMPANAQAVVHQVRSLDEMSHAEFKSALLAGEALPPMPRRLVDKLARLCFGEGAADAEFDPVQVKSLRAALDDLSTTFKR